MSNTKAEYDTLEGQVSVLENKVDALASIVKEMAECLERTGTNLYELTAFHRKMRQENDRKFST